MSKKHFRAIAQALYESSLSDDAREEVVRALAPTLRRLNPLFDMGKFARAVREGL